MRKIDIKKLPYDYSSLNNFIDKETLELHYLRHYSKDVKRLNMSLSDNNLDIDQIIKGISRYNYKIRNYAGSVYNHEFFFDILSPHPQEVNGKVLEHIIKDFKDFSKFKKIFTNEAVKFIGSGWVWLILTNKNKLKIITTQNNDNPLMNVIKNSGYPILALDLWEHSYYLKYKNDKIKYIENFWSSINWNRINEIYEQRTQKKITEVESVKKVIFDGAVQVCSRKQIQFYRRLFNINPEIKKRFMFTIMDILKEVFSDYWFEKGQYNTKNVSGIYDYEQKGRSVINKLNTNYTAFCTIVTEINKHLLNYGVNAINFQNKTKEEQINEVDRLNNYIIELRYIIFDKNSTIFHNLIYGLDKTNKYGNESEMGAVENLKQIFQTENVIKIGDLGNTDDMIKGIDATVELSGETKTLQIKPYNNIKKDEDYIILYGTGNVKTYKTDFMAFHNHNLGTLVFHNDKTKIIDGRYVFNRDSQYNI